MATLHPIQKMSFDKDHKAVYCSRCGEYKKHYRRPGTRIWICCSCGQEHK